MITPTMASNLKTMKFCEPHDPRQAIGQPYTVPNEAVRLLRAKLILEETLETIHALGFSLFHNDEVTKETVMLRPTRQPNLEQIVDGCADLNYVLTGCLVSCGVPDSPHYAEVHRANQDKFPEGKPILNEHGKYLKPTGWKPPDFTAVMLRNSRDITSHTIERPTTWQMRVVDESIDKKTDCFINGVRFFFADVSGDRKQILHTYILNDRRFYQLGFRIEEIHCNWEECVEHAKDYIKELQ